MCSKPSSFGVESCPWRPTPHGGTLRNHSSDTTPLDTLRPPSELSRRRLTNRQVICRVRFRPTPNLPSASQAQLRGGCWVVLRPPIFSRRYLADRATDNVTLDELAIVAGTTRFRLLRLFGAAFGVPPHRYQLAHRIGLARRTRPRSQPCRDCDGDGVRGSEPHASPLRTYARHHTAQLCACVPALSTRTFKISRVAGRITGAVLQNSHSGVPERFDRATLRPGDHGDLAG